MNRRELMALGLTLGATGPLLAAEPDYPARPIRFIVPIAPGSSGDTLTRVFAEQLRSTAGVATFVENRPGADLVVGTQNLLASPADGYSVLLVSTSVLIINPLMIKDLPYKAEELMPLINFLSTPAVVVTGPQGKYRTLAELLEAARRQPGSVSVGVYGNTYRLGLADLAQRAGVRFNVIPYKGASQGVADVIGGAVDAVLLDAGGAAPLVSGGKVRALAVASDKRHSLIPEVPTAAEGGLPGYQLNTFIGFAVHGKTPPAVAEKLETLMLKAMAEPSFRERVARQSGMEVVGTGRAAFASLVASETRRVRELAKGASLEGAPAR